jgi:hypothetical protein
MLKIISQSKLQYYTMDFLPHRQEMLDRTTLRCDTTPTNARKIRKKGRFSPNTNTNLLHFMLKLSSLTQSKVQCSSSYDVVAYRDLAIPSSPRQCVAFVRYLLW